MNPHGQAGPGKLFSPHFSPGSDVFYQHYVWIHYELIRFLVQLRFFGNHGFQPNASSDCNTRLGQRSPGAGKQHGLAGPRELFSPHFSPGADVKTSRLNPLRTSEVFGPASVLWKPWFLAQCFLRLQHTPGPAQPRSGETAWPGRSRGAIFASLFARCRCQNVTAESIKN